MSDPLKTIVIGTSLSESSDDIVRTGAAIADAMEAIPWLIHVHSVPGYPIELLGAVEGTWMADYAEIVRDQLAQQANRAGLAGVAGFGPGQLQAVRGSKYREIVELATRVKADLIVIGASEGGSLRDLLDSTADGVIRTAPCPVLVVRSAFAFPPDRVEIPVDLSPVSASALRQGMDFLARLGVRLDNTEVLLVLNPLEVSASTQFTPDQIERFALDELQRFLKANGAGPELARVRTGYPWKEILAAMEEKRADLAVLGTHGRKGLERLMLGSVAAGVMHRAPCNLLIVPPEAGPRRAAAEKSAERTGADWSFVSDERPSVAS